MQPLAGSAADFIAQGFKKGGLRRSQNGVPGAGSEVKWPEAFVQDITAAIVRCEISYDVRKADFANFGPILAPAVMKYVRVARQKYSRASWLPAELRQPPGEVLSGVAFLHSTPLGDVDADHPIMNPRPQILDAWAETVPQQQTQRQHQYSEEG